MLMNQRLVESTVHTYGNAVTGTWAINKLYRTFGASIGDLCVIRNKTPAVSFPDMLNLGSKYVCLNEQLACKCCMTTLGPRYSR